jgi:hypothetical protein
MADNGSAAGREEESFSSGALSLARMSVCSGGFLGFSLDTGIRPYGWQRAWTSVSALMLT